jgi:hypothetical protein
MLKQFTLSKAILLAAFALLQVLDVVTTKQVLANGGWEGNPIGVLAMTVFGSYWAIPKLAVMAICAAAMVRWQQKHIAPFVAVMAAVVVNNAIWAY